ncbi:unnamed protein product [Ceratitis capitata]|uniref:(Mediterranean fruit fly) hypothetical protein n=1 Tax=Ceratitis capitata TaxID=7213 RepID=A0A811UUE5_CERCA|nr:unnamed protein product [Ceratitis capitata]
MHNPLLSQSILSTPPVIASDSRNGHLLNCHDGRRDTCLYKILPVILLEAQANVKVYTLLEEGSSVTLLQEAVGNAIGVNRCHYNDLDNSHVSITEMTVHAGPDEPIAYQVRMGSIWLSTVSQCICPMPTCSKVTYTRAT